MPEESILAEVIRAAEQVGTVRSYQFDRKHAPPDLTLTLHVYRTLIIPVLVLMILRPPREFSDPEFLYLVFGEPDAIDRLERIADVLISDGKLHPPGRRSKSQVGRLVSHIHSLCGHQGDPQEPALLFTPQKKSSSKAFEWLIPTTANRSLSTAN